MSPLLRSRVALLALLGAFAIPVGMSSLRGLTHLLTCSEPAETPFTVVVPPAELGPPQIISSTRITRADQGGLCGGLLVDLGVHVDGSDLALKVGISNRSELLWKGSVELEFAGTTIPVSIGEVAPGDSEARFIDVELQAGSHDLDGSLLIGP